MASINTYPNEVTPLVRSVSAYPRDESSNHYHCNNANRVVLCCFLAILLAGTFCGVYLLTVENGMYKKVERFDIVTKREWGVRIHQTKNTSRPNLPFGKILLIQMKENCSMTDGNQTSNEDCNTIELNTDIRHYSKNVEKYYGVKEIWYNFYVNSEGTVFEGRGFNMEAFCGDGRKCGDTLTIGAKGLIYSNSKASNLALKLKAFLDYGISRNMLNPCFEILVKDLNNSGKLMDVYLLINKWDRKMRKGNYC